MNITNAQIKDIEDIMKIIDQAKVFLNANNINQWQDGYPNVETIKNDILKQQLYVVKENEFVVGLFALIDYEKTYDHIYEGEWLNDSNYIAVHRIAILNEYKGKGVAKYIFDQLKKEYNHIRVDTHELNINMQKCLLKNDFKYCGIIYLDRAESDTKRLAYEYFV